MPISMADWKKMVEEFVRNVKCKTAGRSVDLRDEYD